MHHMNDSLELRGDERDEYLANLEAESGTDPEIVDQDELMSLLGELWQEELEREQAMQEAREQDEYTEEDAFRDFYSDYADSME
jgi:hypothetical protein